MQISGQERGFLNIEKNKRQIFVFGLLFLLCFPMVHLLADPFMTSPRESAAVPDEAMAQAEVQSGIVSYWKLNEGTGINASDSIDGNSGALTNGPSWVAGQVDDALDFDGTNDYVNVPDDPSLDFGIGDFSFEAWIKPDVVSGTRTIVDKRQSNAGYSVYIYAGRLGLQLRDGAFGNYVAPSNVSIGVDGEWHFVAVAVQRNSTAFFYVDSNSASLSIEHQGSLDNSANLWIGGNLLDSAYYFNGGIDEVALYNRTLTQEEIERHYENSLAGRDYVLYETDITQNKPANYVGNTGFESWYYYAGGVVNTANGNLYLFEEDSSAKARGFDLGLGRSYNAHNSEFKTVFGYGWTFSYNTYLLDYGRYVLWVRSDGAAHRYDSNENGTYSTPAGVNVKLSKKNDSYVLWFKTGTTHNFDQTGKLNSITDKNGNNLTLTYSDDKITRIDDDSGIYLNINYTAYSLVSSIEDVLGRETFFGYDSHQNLANVTDPMGYVTKYRYEGHYLSTIADPLGKTLLFEYDNALLRAAKSVYLYSENRNGKSLLNPIKLQEINYAFPSTTITDPGGYGTVIKHNAAGNPANKTDPLGYVSKNEWDSNMNVVGFTDGNGHSWNYSYDGRGNLIASTDPSGNSTLSGWENIDTDSRYVSLLRNETNELGYTTYYSYDTKGNLNATVDALDNVKKYSYDSRGNLVTSIDPRGYSTNYSYDVHGNVINFTDAIGNVTRQSYDGACRLVSVTNANGYSTNYTYDDNDNVIKIRDATGNETIYNYDARGKLTGVIDAKGQETKYSYNTLDIADTATDASGNATYYRYDRRGNIARTTDALGHVTDYSYDADNRLDSVTDAYGNAENYSYDPVGNMISYTDKNNHTTRYTYDALNGLTRKTDALGYNETYTYDSVGNLLVLTDANSHATSYEFDKLNRLVKIKTAMGYETRYEYDASGNLKKVTDPVGNNVTMAYNGMDNVVRKQYTDYAGFDKGNISYGYDPVGNLVHVDGGSRGVIDYSYDKLNRNLGATVNYSSFTKTISYSYDANGNVVAMINPNAEKTNYTYDKVNGLTSIEYPNAGLFKFSYDEAGRRTRIEYPFGGNISYVYDDVNRLLAIVPSGIDVPQISYTYYANGNVLTMTTGGKTTAYGYDDKNQLVSELTPVSGTGYTYDGVGNRLTRQTWPGGPLVEYEYDADNKLLSSTNGIDYAYDANGNLVQKNDTGDITRYGYDIDNNLVKVTLPSLSNISYVICPLGKRIAETTSSGTEYYIYDRGDRLMKFNSSGSILYNYYQNPVVIDETLGYRNVTSAYLQTFDALGSVRSIIDAAGNRLSEITYDAFGNNLDAAPHEYGYTGQIFDPETGLYYYKARMYDPHTGRFTSKDPLGVIGGSNMYRYVNNNPLASTDPTGTMMFGVFELMGMAACWMLESFDGGSGSSGAAEAYEKENARINRYAEEFGSAHGNAFCSGPLLIIGSNENTGGGPTGYPAWREEVRMGRDLLGDLGVSSGDIHIRPSPSPSPTGGSVVLTIRPGG